MKLASVLATLSFLVGACATPTQATTTLSGNVTIFAASSLAEAFNALGKEFSTANPQVTVTPNYAGSAILVAQLSQGAEADIFASADEANMQKLVDTKQSEGTPTIFAHNKLQIAVQAGNPKNIMQLSDLTRPNLIVVLGTPAVPVGGYAIQAFDKAGVKVTAKSLETDVRAVLGKVSLGEADAGIVYSTDVKARGAKIKGIDIPDQYNVVARYPITLVKGGTNAKAAQAFIDFVRSAKGREILTSFGFVAP